jgi:hypothetical protein
MTRSLNSARSNTSFRPELREVTHPGAVLSFGTNKKTHWLVVEGRRIMSIGATFNIAGFLPVLTGAKRIASRRYDLADTGRSHSKRGINRGYNPEGLENREISWR